MFLDLFSWPKSKSISNNEVDFLHMGDLVIGPSGNLPERMVKF